MEKITNLKISYPKDLEPDTINPKNNRHLRYLLGKNIKAKKLFTVILMNPSKADLKISDRTVSKVISTSKVLGYDGYLIFNLYPVRATDAKTLNKFDLNICKKNISFIKKYILKLNIKNIFTLWGDVGKNETLSSALPFIKKLLIELKINTYCFKINKSNEPAHPLYLKLSRENIVRIKF